MRQKHSKSQQRRQEDKARRRKHRLEHQMTPARPRRAGDETDLLLMKAFDDMQARGALAGMPTEFNPPGQEKMSEILQEFVEPYLQYTENVPQVEKLMVVASVAWNAALMEGDNRASLLQGMRESIPPDARDDTLAIIDGMIKRKLKHFAAYRRFVVSVQVTDTGDGFHLAVASLEPGPTA